MSRALELEDRGPMEAEVHETKVTDLIHTEVRRTVEMEVLGLGTILGYQFEITNILLP